MKKLLLLGACAVAAVAANAATLYIDNQVGYVDPCVYAWGDVRDIFGNWPGAKPSATVSVDGVDYLKYDIPAEGIGTNQNIIFNGDDGVDAEGYSKRVQLPEFSLILEDQDYYLKATEEGLVPADGQESYGINIYIDDQVGYGVGYLYAWGDGEPEYLGGWPGQRGAWPIYIGETAYTKFSVPAAAIGKNLNLIFNCESNQLGDYNLTVEDHDYYFVATEAGLTPAGAPVVTEKVAFYTLDKTGWDEIYVYAYCAEGGPEIFGGWPGTKLTDVLAKDGQTYKTAEVYETDKEYVLIWNNGKVGEEEGEAKVEVENALWTPTAPIAYEVTLDSATEIAVPELDNSGVAAIEAGNEEAVYFNLQGVKVANPEKGLFIKVCAGKSSKVVL